MKTFNLFNYLPSFQVHTTPERKICSSTWNCRYITLVWDKRRSTWCSAINHKPLSTAHGINNLRAKYQWRLTSSTNNVITIPETNKRNLQLNTDPVSKSVIMSSSVSVSCDAYTLQVWFNHVLLYYSTK